MNPGTAFYRVMGRAFYRGYFYGGLKGIVNKVVQLFWGNFFDYVFPIHFLLISYSFPKCFKNRN